MTAALHYIAHHEISTGQCYLQFELTFADHFLEYVQSKQLFTTFAESSSVFVFSSSRWEILLSVFRRKIFYIPTGFFYQNFIFRTQFLVLRSNCDVAAVEGKWQCVHDSWSMSMSIVDLYST